MSDVIETQAYIIEPEKKSRHYKWWFVGAGALIVLLGVACLLWPAATLEAVAIVVGIGFLLAGITSVASYFDLCALVPMGGWSLASGVVDVILGVVFLAHPTAGGVALAWLMGAVVIAGGVMDAVCAWRLRQLAGTGIFLLGELGALATVVFGILMLAMPELLVLYLGCMAIVRGVILIVAAFKVSSLIRGLKSQMLE
jgi:uncharacterized membrane protein HdeD (DUF308 family)